MSYFSGGYGSHRAWSTGLPVDGPNHGWKPKMGVVKVPVEFLIQTGGWKNSRGD